MEFRIIGKNIDLRPVNCEDAKFIINLRLSYGQYLSKTDEDIQKQIKWIKSYKEKEKNGLEYYFIIMDKPSNPVGVVRLYNINYKEESFTFGSFIIDKKRSPELAALEAMTLVFDYAFNKLNLKDCFFDCRKDNIAANNFYLRYKAQLIGEGEKDFFYHYKKSLFLENSCEYYDIINNENRFSKP